MGRVFLIFHHSVPLQHRHIVGAEHIGDVLGKNIVIGMTDNLVRGEVKELFKPAIGEKIPAVGVFHVDHGGGVVDHVLQELLAPAKRILRLFAIRHALEGAGHTGHPAGLVPDRLAAGAEPVIRSCLGEKPVFHVVGIAAFDMGGQGSEDAVGILGMKPGSPALQDIGKFLVGITQHGLDTRRPPNRCARRTPWFVGEHLSIPEAVIGALDHELQAFFALAEEVFCPFDLHGEFLDPYGATERVPEFLPVVWFCEIRKRPLHQQTHSAITRDIGGHNHDRDRGVQALSFFQDLQPIAVRKA